MINKGEKYIASIDYSDGYADIKAGDIVIPERVSFSNGISWVYFLGGHPLSLEVFIHCFVSPTT